MVAKTASITESSSGIGQDVARAFLERGWSIVLNGRDQQCLAEAAARFGAPERVATVAGNIGDVSDTSEAVLYLAEARFVTGHILRVDGGYLTGRRT